MLLYKSLLTLAERKVIAPTKRGKHLHQGEELPDGNHNLELCLARGEMDKVPSVDLHWISACIPGKEGHRQEQLKPSPHHKLSFKEAELREH